MVLQKKKTHKTKSAERILLQQNHRSKNIIICQKITKQTKQNSYTSLEIFFFKYIILQKGR
jgi:hypothetical protein